MYTQEISSCVCTHERPRVWPYKRSLVWPHKRSLSWPHKRSLVCTHIRYVVCVHTRDLLCVHTREILCAHTRDLWCVHTRDLQCVYTQEISCVCTQDWACYEHRKFTILGTNGVAVAHYGLIFNDNEATSFRKVSRYLPGLQEVVLHSKMAAKVQQSPNNVFYSIVYITS